MNSIQKLGPSYDTQVVEVRSASDPGPGLNTARTEADRNVRALLDTVISGLGPQQREIILLFHQQNWPIAQIARHLQIPKGTVKSHLHRGRKRMRRLIQASCRMNRQAQEVFS